MSSERERDARRKRKTRSSAREVHIPPCADRERRERLEADDVEWLRFYFATLFWYDFTAQQREMIAAIRTAIDQGGDQAIAASRGEGKTTLAQRLILKAILQGAVPFAVLFAATGSGAQDSLQSIMQEIETNDLLLADYPEVCVPVRALEGVPNRAAYMLVSGLQHDSGEPYKRKRAAFRWCGNEVFLPAVPGSPSAAAIIATRGLDSAVRGLNKKGRRPTLAVLDDVDTEETANSREQATKLEKRIDRGIAGMGGQQRTCARVMLCTTINQICCAFRFTDSTIKHSWNGRRFRFLITPPEREELWTEYVSLRQLDWPNETNTAHEYYVAHREQMDAGAVVANPNRFTANEASALEFYFVQVARIGQDAVSAEFDNNPPAETGPVESGITASLIQHKLSGYGRRVVPDNCTVVSQGIDCKKAGLHWVVKASAPDATCHTIDYGFFETHGTKYGSDEGVELAVRRAIVGRMEELKSQPFCRQDGTPVPVGLTLIDSSWLAPAVYQACREIGLGIYPAKGHGKSEGCATPSFHEQQRRTIDRKPGDGWFLSRQPAGVWLCNTDTDRWKAHEHARWMTPDGKPGAAYLFGEITEEERRHMPKALPKAAKDHHGFARHITAEVEVEDLVRGTVKRFWKVRTGRAANHYLDASYLANVAAAMQGVRLLGAPAQPMTSPLAAAGPPKTFAQLRQEAKAKK